MATKKKSLTKNVPKKNRYAAGKIVDDDQQMQADALTGALRDTNVGQTWRGASQAYDDSSGGAAVGHVVRGALATVPAFAADVASGWKQIIQPAANFLKTAVTGDDTPAGYSPLQRPPAQPAPTRQAVPGPRAAIPNDPYTHQGIGAAGPQLPTSNRVAGSEWAPHIAESRGANGNMSYSQVGSNGAYNPEAEAAINRSYGGSPPRDAGGSFGSGGVYGMGFDQGDPTRDRWNAEARMDKMMNDPKGYAAVAAMMGHQGTERIGQAKNALGYQEDDTRRYSADRTADAARFRTITDEINNARTNSTSRLNNRDTIAGQQAVEGIRGTNQLANTGLHNAGQMAIQTGRQAFERPERDARVALNTAQANAAKDPALTHIRSMVLKQFETASPEEQQKQVDVATARYYRDKKAAGGEVEGYEGGGALPKEAPLGGMPDMPPIRQEAAAPQMADPNLIAYLRATQAFGLPNRSDVYAQAKTQRLMAQQGNLLGMGDNVQMAVGGPVPVQGQELQGVGAAAGGPTEDTIPAVIDGSRPAALSSGEFVVTAKATESVGAPVLRAIMKGLEQGNPSVIQGLLQVAAKASAPQKEPQAIMRG